MISQCTSQSLLGFILQIIRQGWRLFYLHPSQSLLGFIAVAVQLDSIMLVKKSQSLLGFIQPYISWRRIRKDNNSQSLLGFICHSAIVLARRKRRALNPFWDLSKTKKQIPKFLRRPLSIPFGIYHLARKGVNVNIENISQSLLGFIKRKGR